MTSWKSQDYLKNESYLISKSKKHRGMVLYMPDLAYALQQDQIMQLGYTYEYILHTTTLIRLTVSYYYANINDIMK